MRRQHPAAILDVQRPCCGLEAEPLQAIHQQRLERVPKLPQEQCTQGVPGRLQRAVHGLRQHVRGVVQGGWAGGQLPGSADQVCEPEAGLLEGKSEYEWGEQVLELWVRVELKDMRRGCIGRSRGDEIKTADGYMLRGILMPFLGGLGRKQTMLVD